MRNDKHKDLETLLQHCNGKKSYKILLNRRTRHHNKQKLKNRLIDPEDIVFDEQISNACYDDYHTGNFHLLTKWLIVTAAKNNQSIRTTFSTLKIKDQLKQFFGDSYCLRDLENSNYTVESYRTRNIWRESKYSFVRRHKKHKNLKKLTQPMLEYVLFEHFKEKQNIIKFNSRDSSEEYWSSFYSTRYLYFFEDALGNPLKPTQENIHNFVQILINSQSSKHPLPFTYSLARTLYYVRSNCYTLYQTYIKEKMNEQILQQSFSRNQKRQRLVR